MNVNTERFPQDANDQQQWKTERSKQPLIFWTDETKINSLLNDGKRIVWKPKRIAHDHKHAM